MKEWNLGGSWINGAETSFFRLAEERAGALGAGRRKSSVSSLKRGKRGAAAAAGLLYIVMYLLT